MTICTRDRECLFGDIVADKMRLNDAGRVVQECWGSIPSHFPHVELDEFVVMPNHVHGILVITDIGYTVATNVRAKDFSPLQPQNQSVTYKTIQRPRGTSKTIGSIVRGFKIGVTKWIRNHSAIRDVWQRNYWDHIIRNEQELNRIREYIQNNPAQWEMDRMNPCRGEKSFAHTFAPAITPTMAPTVCESSSEYKREAWMI